MYLPESEVVEEVQQYLATNLTAQVTLAEISNQVGLSPITSVLFFESNRKTIFEHLGDLPQKAQFLLRKTELPIYSIAEQVGSATSLLLVNFSVRPWESRPPVTENAKKRNTSNNFY